MALLPVNEALERILKTAVALGSEDVRLDDCLGRIVVRDVKAKHNQPPFNASAMDGYAVCHEDVSQVPVTLKRVGTSAAGHPFRGVLKKGETVRILTGAPVPQGADTVVIQENTQAAGAALTALEATALGRNIRKAGLDFSKGDVLVAKNTRLSARDLGLAASGDHASLRVRIKPRIAILTTGDELTLPGARRRHGQISSSNATALKALAVSLGAEVVDLGIVKDDLRALTRAITKARAADILVTTGGASVGDHDFMQEALRLAGIKIGFWKIALRPGKPLMFGTKGRLRVLGLPGNPVSAFVCAYLFLKPLIEAMQGVRIASEPVLARLGADLPANDSRQDYLRSALVLAPDGTRIATPASQQDSSMQRTLRNASCLIIREPFAKAAKSGENVPILLFPEGV